MVLPYEIQLIFYFYSLYPTEYLFVFMLLRLWSCLSHLGGLFVLYLLIGMIKQPSSDNLSDILCAETDSRGGSYLNGVTILEGLQ